jgi:hypothetical protein
MMATLVAQEPPTLQAEAEAEAEGDAVLLLRAGGGPQGEEEHGGEEGEEGEEDETYGAHDEDDEEEGVGAEEEEDVMGALDWFDLHDGTGTSCPGPTSFTFLYFSSETSGLASLFRLSVFSSFFLLDRTARIVHRLRIVSLFRPFPLDIWSHQVVRLASL